MIGDKINFHGSVRKSIYNYINADPTNKGLDLNNIWYYTFGTTNLIPSRAIYLGTRAEITEHLKPMKLNCKFYTITTSLSTLEKKK